MNKIALIFIAGVLCIMLLSFLSTKLRNHLIHKNAQLKFGYTVVVLAWTCLTFSLLSFSAFFYDNDVWTKNSEFYSVVGLFIGFGIASIYCFAEFFRVHGFYDEYHIEFYTPWTGQKNETWNNLNHAKFDASTSWYILEFKSGKKIRLSTLIHGHREVIAALMREK